MPTCVEPADLTLIILCVYFISCFSQGFKKWLEEVTTELQGVSDSKCQFISSVLITCCLKECDIQLEFTKFVHPLLKMLCVQPNVKNKSCFNISYLLDITAKTFRYLILVLVNESLCMAVLYIIVILHFQLQFAHRTLICEKPLLYIESDRESACRKHICYPS